MHSFFYYLRVGYSPDIVEYSITRQADGQYRARLIFGGWLGPHAPGDERTSTGPHFRLGIRGEKKTARLCCDPLKLNDHQVVDDDFEQHFKFTSHRGVTTQVAAEVAFEHAHRRLGLCALAVGFAGLSPFQLALHESSVPVGGGLAGRSADLRFDP